MTVLHRASPSRVFVEPDQREGKFSILDLRDWPTREQLSLYAIAPGIDLGAPTQGCFMWFLNRELVLPKRIIMRTGGHSTEHVIVDLIPAAMKHDPADELLAYLQDSLEFDDDNDYHAKYGYPRIEDAEVVNNDPAEQPALQASPE